MKLIKGLTVIIPCYNSAKTIMRCLGSIPDKEDVYIIVIDDCSKDSSVAVVKKFMAKSRRNISLYINESNIGPGRTRNYGISRVTTEYLSFLDSDDELSSDFYDTIRPLMDGSIDLIVYDAMHIFPLKKTYMHMFYSDKISAGIITSTDALVYIKGCTCGKVYKTRIIYENEISFGFISRNEDLIFTKTATSHCDSVFYLAKPLYLYNDNESSLMNNKSLLSINNALTAFDAIKERIDNEKYIKELNSIFFIEVLYSTTTTLISQGEKRQIIAKHYSQYRSYYNGKDPYFNRYSKVYKISFFLMKLRFFKLYMIIRKVFGR